MANNLAPVPTIQPSVYAGGNPYSTYNPYMAQFQQYGSGQPQQQQKSSGGSNILSSIPTSNPFSGGGAISGLVDTAGAHLGFGSGASVVGAAGPLQPVAGAGSLTSVPLSGVLGPAALGFLGGGLLAKATGGNELGGSIGGGLGAGIAAGAGFGPIGMIAGGLIGAFGGSLFGNKKPSDKTMAGGFSLATGEINPDYQTKWSDTGAKYDDSNASFRDKVQGSTSNFSQWLLKNGATLKDAKDPDKTLVMVNGSRDGLRYFTRGINGDDPIKNFGDDYTTYSQSMAKDIISQYNIPPELQTQLDKLKFDDITNINDGSQTGAGYTYTPPMVQAKKGDNNTFEAFYNKYKQVTPNAA